MDWYCENVINGDLNIDKVYESETILAFHHTKPFWEHHIVVVPSFNVIFYTFPLKNMHIPMSA